MRAGKASSLASKNFKCAVTACSSKTSKKHLVRAVWSVEAASKVEMNMHQTNLQAAVLGFEPPSTSMLEVWPVGSKGLPPYVAAA